MKTQHALSRDSLCYNDTIELSGLTQVGTAVDTDKW